VSCTVSDDVNHSALTYFGWNAATLSPTGTNDSTLNGFKWTPSNAAPASNMVQVAAYEYDNGGVGADRP